jgi:hypothetical protein
VESDDYVAVDVKGRVEVEVEVEVDVQEMTLPPFRTPSRDRHRDERYGSTSSSNVDVASVSDGKIRTMWWPGRVNVWRNM